MRLGTMRWEVWCPFGEGLGHAHSAQTTKHERSPHSARAVCVIGAHAHSSSPGRWGPDVAPCLVAGCPGFTGPVPSARLDKTCGHECGFCDEAYQTSREFAWIGPVGCRRAPERPLWRPRRDGSMSRISHNGNPLLSRRSPTRDIIAISAQEVPMPALPVEATSVAPEAPVAARCAHTLPWVADRASGRIVRAPCRLCGLSGAAGSDSPGGERVERGAA